MTHANAPFTPEGRRRLAMLIVDEGWTVRRAAERFQCSPATASRWARRYRAGQSLTDRSSRPQRSPHRTSRRTERRIIALRCTRRWGPHRISYHLGIPRSTIERVLARYRMPLLAPPRPSHRPSRPQAQADPLRGHRSWHARSLAARRGRAAWSGRCRPSAAACRPGSGPGSARASGGGTGGQRRSRPCTMPPCHGHRMTRDPQSG
jgi:transposase-like protein